MNNQNIKGYNNKILKYLFDNKYYKEELIKNIKMNVLSNFDNIINDKKVNIDLIIRLPKENYTKEEIEQFIDYVYDNLLEDNFINNILLEVFLENKEKILKYLENHIKIIEI